MEEKSEAWVGRDKDGSLWLFNHKPLNGATTWDRYYIREDYTMTEIDPTLFPEVVWDDDNPQPKRLAVV